MLGATGQLGRAAVRALAGDGWEVTAVSRGGGRDARWDDGVRAVALDREEEGALESALGEGCDVLVDMVAFGPAHARQLRSLSGRVGSAVVISSGAVYEDDRGRSFDTQGEPDGFPRYPVPLPETQRTTAAGPRVRGRVPLPPAPCGERGRADPAGRPPPRLPGARRGGPGGAHGRGDRGGDRRGAGPGG
ncbi:hypothetical protein GCM10010498_54580 [Streptomyces cavourensis]|nr:hypothetical protein GCM10010498_54580 [Streptomyces cavourensis]